eukprot:symbB.v1.2.018990.t1/scaffold1501.1/size122984/2
MLQMPLRKNGERRTSSLALMCAVTALLSTFTALNFVNGEITPSRGLASQCETKIAMEAKKRETWPIKQRQNAEYLARHPRPPMTEKERKRRLLKIQLFRRQDLMLCEQFLYNDPRDERWQWDVDKTRQFLDEQATLVDDVKKKKLTTREDLGLPLPPTDLKLNAMAKIQRSSAVQASKEKSKSEEKTTGKEKTRRGGPQEPDLSNVDIDFMNYKGLVMTRRQKAQFAQRAQRAKTAKKR